MLKKNVPLDKGLLMKGIKFSLLLMAIALVALLFNKFESRTAYSSDNVREQLERFQEVFLKVNRDYVESPDCEKIITGAITGMLSELDPHSVYIPPDQYQRTSEEMQGEFEGIGIEFIILNKILTVVSPIVGGPSEKVGLLPGDQIIRIEGESAYNIKEDEVQKKLRGEKGTKVTITINRPGQADQFDVTITRDKIPIYSVMASFLLDDKKTGYIYLGRFAKDSAQEVEDALNKLEALGMKRLIFDLRGNAGGMLSQAFEVVDKFIPGGYKIVYTQGRIPDTYQELYSTNRNTHDLYPLIVLISNGSASASEIVAGAVQDLDRGFILGQNSFGKGLVQNEYRLEDGGALRLTVARYYTPSGRLIQRPYEDGNLVDYYAEAYNDSAAVHKPDSSKQFTTLAGRTVYGGGGITPDSILVSEKITRFTYRLITKRIFFEFGSTWTSAHQNAYSDFETFKNKFKIDKKMVNILKEIIKKNDIEFSQEAYEKDMDYIHLLMKAEVARHLWDSEHYYMIRVKGDSEVENAKNLMHEAERIKNLHAWNSVG